MLEQWATTIPISYADARSYVITIIDNDMWLSLEICDQKDSDNCTLKFAFFNRYTLELFAHIGRPWKYSYMFITYFEIVNVRISIIFDLINSWTFSFYIKIEDFQTVEFLVLWVPKSFTYLNF